MKKYWVYFDDLCEEGPDPQPGFTDHEVYLASEVDARIDALERTLRKIAANCSEIQGGAPPHVWIPAAVRKLGL